MDINYWETIVKHMLSGNRTLGEGGLSEIGFNISDWENNPEKVFQGFLPEGVEESSELTLLMFSFFDNIEDESWLQAFGDLEEIKQLIE
jgi:hypothetical protein